MRRCVGVLFALWCVVGVASGVRTRPIAGSVMTPRGCVARRGRRSLQPALIEDRSVVTDGTGQYKIVDLRPDLRGLSAPGLCRRQAGDRARWSVTATVNADLRCRRGGETVTAGETPSWTFRTR